MNYLRCKQQSCQRDIKRLKEREFQLHSELITASQELQRLRLILRDHQSATSSIAAYEGSPVWDRVEESRDLSQRITISHQYLRIDSTTTIFYWATPSDSDTWWIFSFDYSSSIFVSPLASPCPPPSTSVFVSSLLLRYSTALGLTQEASIDSIQRKELTILSYFCVSFTVDCGLSYSLLYIYIYIYIFTYQRDRCFIFFARLYDARVRII